jgi:hypothetical protein
MPKPELEFFKTVSVPEEVMDEKGLASEQCASFWLKSQSLMRNFRGFGHCVDYCMAHFVFVLYEEGS